MPWFKVDDGFWSHPKTLQLSDGAQALWVRAGSWSMHHLTDGRIPSSALRILNAKPRFVNELVTVSLWFPDKDGYRFHDWSSYQPTREQVETDRQAAAERKRRSREKSRVTDAGTDGGSHGVRPDSPSHPVPSQPTPLDLTDTEHDSQSGHVGERASARTDLEREILLEAKQSGIDDLPAVIALFEPIIGRVKPRDAIELGRTILARSKQDVRRSTPYIARACEDSEEIRHIAFDVLDLMPTTA